MAIDSAQKRASSYTFNSYWALPSVWLEGDFGQEEKQAALWNYSGVLAGELVEVHIATPTVVTTPGAYPPVPQVAVVYVRALWREWLVEAPARVARRISFIRLRRRVKVVAQWQGYELSAPSRLVTAQAVAMALPGFWASVVAHQIVRSVARCGYGPWTAEAKGTVIFSQTGVQRVLEEQMEAMLVLGIL